MKTYSIHLVGYLLNPILMFGLLGDRSCFLSDLLC